MDPTAASRHVVPGAALGPRQFGLDALIAVVFTVFCIVVTHAIAQDSTDRYDAWTVLAIVVIGGVLAARRIAPGIALAVQTIALAAYTWAGFAGGPVYLAPMVLLYTIAAAGDRRRTWWTGAAVMGAFVVLAVTGDDPRTHVAYLAAFGGWAAGALFLGRATANRRQYLGELEQRARDLEDSREEEARRRVAEERVRIARDLHDAVAHGIATIHLRAATALHVLDRDPHEPERALRAIKHVSKETLTELRRTLGLLRAADDDAPLAPTPGLDRLDELVDDTRRAGLHVQLDVQLHPQLDRQLDRDAVAPADADTGIARLPLAVDVAAYRIVQESLTNVIKHAGGQATAHVVVRHDGTMLDIEVTDDGRGPAVRNGDEPDTGRDTGHDTGHRNGGHGIDGMRERAATLGGTLEVGRREGGGFRVHARLPAPVTTESVAP
jgi:signal transduction histidine kinase